MAQTTLILNAVALGMGVASIVLTILGETDVTIFLAIGLSCLALNSLDKS